jgi:hypothetical protein
MSRRKADRPSRYVVRAFATIVALAVTATIIALSFGLFAVRFVGLDAYVVQGGPTESMVPIGSLVLVAPVPSRALVTADQDSPEAPPAPIPGTAWVAIPTLGYAVTYAETYSSPIAIGILVWILFLMALRALEPYFSTARRRVPA